MTLDLTLRALVGLLPVACFLAAMRYFDSYKLVHLRPTLVLVGAGALAAGGSYLAGDAAMGALGIDFRHYSRYVGPLVEEVLKGAVIVWLVARHRIAFLVDAAICGFAVGAGFAMAENLFYLRLLPDAVIGVWIVRGFGTAIMHGGVTALFGVLGLLLVERGLPRLLAFLPGLALAAVLHSAYNHFFFSPVLATAGILALLPPLAWLVFARSESSLEEWLESGFDADTRLLELINGGKFPDSRVGRYLESLKARFDGPVVADLLCYLRMRTELALRAKGILMLRESGFEPPPPDADTRDKFAELEYLERSIGPTGLLAIKPFVRMSRRDLWQLHQIER